MAFENNPTAGQQDVEYQEDPYGGDPKQHAIKQILEQLARDTYGKTLGALSRDEFEPLLGFIEQNKQKIQQQFQGSLAQKGIEAAGRGLDSLSDTVQGAVRGDQMSGDIGLSDIGNTRPAHAVKSAGEGLVRLFQQLEQVANKRF